MKDISKFRFKALTKYTGVVWEREREKKTNLKLEKIIMGLSGDGDGEEQIAGKRKRLIKINGMRIEELR